MRLLFAILLVVASLPSAAAVDDCRSLPAPALCRHLEDPPPVPGPPTPPPPPSLPPPDVPELPDPSAIVGDPPEPVPCALAPHHAPTRPAREALRDVHTPASRDLDLLLRDAESPRLLCERAF